MTTATIEDGWVGNLDSFSARLAVVRQQMGWNIKEAALACGFPHTSWRHWELDGKEPRNYIATVEQISARTRCDYGWLLDGRPSGSPTDPSKCPHGDLNPGPTAYKVPVQSRRLYAVPASLTA